VFSNLSGGSWAYDYDGAGRLIEAAGPNATGDLTTWEYAYDGGGNRIEVAETTGQDVISDLSTSYDAQGLPVSASDRRDRGVDRLHPRRDRQPAGDRFLDRRPRCLLRLRPLRPHDVR
jgi:hypothetical protein